MIPTALAGTVLAAAGLLVAGPAVHRLGRSRAAAKWHPDTGNRAGRGLLTLIAFCGVATTAAGSGLLATRLPELLRLDIARVPPVLVGIVAGVLVHIVGMYVAAKSADRVELGALIRGPAPGAAGQPGSDTPAGRSADPRLRDSDPDVPPTAEPGMVYRDAGGAWYLVVSAGTGFRLVALPNFALTPPGTVRPPITPAGSVELSVWPLARDTAATGAHGGTNAPAGQLTSHP